jgi:hypothetical protein
MAGFASRPSLHADRRAKIKHEVTSTPDHRGDPPGVLAHAGHRVTSIADLNDVPPSGPECVPTECRNWDQVVTFCSQKFLSRRRDRNRGDDHASTKGLQAIQARRGNRAPSSWS